MRLHGLTGILLLLPLGLVGEPRARDAGGDSLVERPPDWEITAASEEAVRRGLAWLAGSQSADGSWSGSGGQYQVAMTSLAGLAFLAGGSVPGEGPYGGTVRRAAEFLVRQADPMTGLIATPSEGREMYGHGFAMLFLAELYGMGANSALDERIRRVLDRGVELSRRSQSAQGGWYYSPNSASDEGSVTITQVQGLRAARNAGIAVPPEVIRNAIQYIVRSQNPDGGIAYRIGQGGSRPGITAPGMAVMFNAGDFSEEYLEVIRKGMDYLRIHRRELDGGHFFYCHFYMVQTAYLAGSPHWEEYYPSIRETILTRQAADGSWPDGVGPVYGTALACFILQVPYRYLPILQK